MWQLLPRGLFHPLCSYIGAQTSQGSQHLWVGCFYTMEAHKWVLGFDKNVPPMCACTYAYRHAHTYSRMHTHTHALELLYGYTFLLSCYQEETSDMCEVSVPSMGSTCVHLETAFDWPGGNELSFSVAVERKLDPMASSTMGSSLLVRVLILVFSG